MMRSDGDWPVDMNDGWLDDGVHGRGGGSLPSLNIVGIDLYNKKMIINMF